MADRTCLDTRLARINLATLVAGAALMSAGIPNAGAQEDPSTPCDLLTRSEIKRVFKGKASKGLRDGPTCTWEIKGGSAKRSGADLELTAAGAASVDYDADDGEPVTGLGDEAYFDLANDQLGVTEGDTTLLLAYLTLASVSDDKLQARLERVAEAALESCRALASDYPCGTTDISE
jgi:hypothetical protein